MKGYAQAAVTLDLTIEFTLLAAMQEMVRGKPQPWSMEPAKIERPRPLPASQAIPGIHDRAPHIMVPSSEVFASGQFQRRALDVKWPDFFCMEAGKVDYRVKTPNVEDRNRRHQIDWYRTGSCVEAMPSTEMLTRDGNPYSLAIGIGAHIARKTFDIAFASVLPVKPADIEDAVLAAASERKTTYNALCVKDALRDLALFGMAARLKGGHFAILHSNR